MSRRSVVALVLMLTWVGTALAPASSASAQEVQKFSRFQLTLRDGMLLKGRNGVLSATGVTGQAEDGAAIDLTHDKIAEFHKRKSYTGLGGVAGAAAGLLSGLAIWVLAEGQAAAETSGNTYAYVRHDRVAAITAGLTVGGAVVGALLGSQFEDLEPVPLPGASVSLRPQVAPKRVAVQLALRF